MQIEKIKNTSYEAIIQNGKITKGKISRNSYSDFYFEETYNELGLIICKKTFWVNSKFYSTDFYFYDPNNNEIRFTSYNPDGSIDMQSEKNYDANNLIQLWKHKSNNRSSSETMQYFYDDKNRLILKKDYFNTKLRSYEEIEYIGNFQIIKHYDCERNFQSFQEKINKTFKETLYLNEKGEIETITTIRNDEKEKRLDYTYERVLEKKFTRYIKYKYNDYNDLIEQQEYEDGVLKNIHRFNYSYDECQNYIERIEYINDIPKYIEQREISYRVDRI